MDWLARVATSLYRLADRTASSTCWPVPVCELTPPAGLASWPLGCRRGALSLPELLKNAHNECAAGLGRAALAEEEGRL